MGEVHKIRMYKKLIFVFYLLFLHFTLAVVVVKSDFIQRVENKLGINNEKEIKDHYKNMVAYHSRVDKNLPNGTTLFIGDSHIQGLSVSAVTPLAVNYGIGNDTTLGVIKRLPYYAKSLSTSEAVVIAIGFNDMRFREVEDISANVKKLLASLPKHVRIILCAVHPVGKNLPARLRQTIAEINDAYQAISREYSNVEYHDTFSSLISADGYLPQQYLLSDGVHLSVKGNQVWIDSLRTKLMRTSLNSSL